jgi:HlyD family secretion protein
MSEFHMDIKREGVARNRRIRRTLCLLLFAAAVAAASWRINRLEPAGPVVERATQVIGTVKRGPLVIDVRGPGTLVPEDILWIQAGFDSQVSGILTRSGDEVNPDSVLVVLTSPQMEADADDFEWQTKQAEANYADLEVRLQSQTFDEQSAVAIMQGDLKQAQITKDIEEKLLESHLESQINAKLAIAKWEQASLRFQMERQKLDIMKQSVDAQMEAQKVQIRKLRATWLLKAKQVDDLTIRAGIKGRIQEMTLQMGQRVRAGDLIAKVAEPWKLMARLQIAETQAKDLALGQTAAINTRNGIVPGHVTRIDASIVNGARTVDCKLDGPLPPGSVPDLSVEGSIEIARLENAIYMERPAFGQPDSRTSIFKLDPDGKSASRVSIRLGAASVNNVEILGGLKPGDQVIVSDMSNPDRGPRVRLN